MSINCILLYGNHMMPLTKSAGVFRIKSELTKHGYSVQTIDITAFDNDLLDLYKILTNLIDNNTYWLGFSTTFLYNIFGYPYCRNENSYNKKYKNNPFLEDNLKKFVNFLKDLNPNIKLIAGGSRRFILEKFGFKIFRNYNDKEIIEYTDYLAKKTQKLDLKFLNNIIEGTEFLDFNNSQIEYTHNDIVDPLDSLPIEISRGCIFKCKFCSFPLNGKNKGEWIKNHKVLLDEFKRNYEIFGCTEYSFSDDTYNDSVDKVKSLYDHVFSKLNFKINFSTYIRLDLLMRFPETVEYLKESGLKSALFGIETINHESGKTIGKGVEPKLQFEFIKEIKQTQWKNILTYSGFILGLPNDSIEDMEKLEQFLFSNENFLDDVNVEPLYLKPTDIKDYNRNYYSTFDLEHKKYGYTCYEEIENNDFTEVKWINSKNNMNFDQIYLFCKNLNKKIDMSNKFKYAGFGYGWFRALGIPETDILSLSKTEIRKKYNILKMKKEKSKNYIQKLLNLSK